ncbi:MAG: transposase [Rhodospirillaceae bacterium]|nr:transposase [Rhodospirillaceae bacterium]
MFDVLRTIVWCFIRRLIFGPATEDELLILRHQVIALQRQLDRPLKLSAWDRLFFTTIYKVNPRALLSMLIVKPDTVVRWHRAGFRLFWRIKCRRGVGRLKVPTEIRRLIREMSRANPLWGAPRIHGELLKLGINISQSTVAKYTVKRRGPPSQSWKTFLRNHADGIATIDMFVVPTLGFKVLYGLVILEHSRRRIVHVNATYHPTAEWISRQIVEAFPWDEAPDFLLRDRDASYGTIYRERVVAMGIRDRPVAPRSPWQNGYVERVIGSIRRDLLDHVVILNERHLRKSLHKYADYYSGCRTHLGLDKDTPFGRIVQTVGRIIATPKLGGLHHAYVRM